MCLQEILLHACSSDKRRLAALLGIELFSMIRVICCDSAILGEDFETANKRQSGYISVRMEAATLLVCSALAIEWKYLLLL